MNRIIRYTIGILIAGIASLALALQHLPMYWGAFLFFCFIYLTLSEMWVLTAGFTGMILLGIGGFVGIGAYAFVIFYVCLKWPFWLSLLMSGVAGALISLVVSPAIFKMRGAYFAMASLVVANALYAWFATWSYTGAGGGIIIDVPTSVISIFYLGFILASTSVIIVILIRRSKLGLMLRAIESDEDAASAVGINTFTCKLYCFVIAGFILGLTGAVYFLYPGFVTPGAAFSMIWFINTITIASIGGWRSIEGVIIGTVLVVALQQFFYTSYPGLSLLINGAIIVTIFLLSPRGLWPPLREFIERRSRKFY